MQSQRSAGLIGMLALFVDTVYLLVLASIGTERLVWLTSLFYLYLLIEALMFYTSVQLMVIVAICAVFCGLCRFRLAAAGAHGRGGGRGGLRLCGQSAAPDR